MIKKEPSVLKRIMKVFAREEILLQHYVLGNKIDLCFPKHKTAIELDQKGHKDRKKSKDDKRGNDLKAYLNCKFIRINPDGEDFDMYVEIGRIYNGINTSSKKLTKEPIEKSSKKSLIYKISKKLLKLELKSDY